MNLSKRLKMIVDCVPENTRTVIDVGTDHGYVPIYLIRKGMAQYCIACDMNVQPLKNAKENIAHYHMNANIDTRLGSGLSKISVQEAKDQVIIMAGMGGMLIIDILRHDLDLVKAVGLLILQAQLDIEPLRRYLHTIDFKIIDEKMIYEDGQYYTVIVAKPGPEEVYSDTEYLLGKKLIESKNPILKDFIKYKMNSINELTHHLSHTKTKQAKERLQELEKENRLYEEVFACL